MLRASRITLLIAAAFAVTTSLVHANNRDGHDAGPSEWTIIASYPLPEGASGLAWDGTNLYCGIYGANGDRVYQINPTTGVYSPLFIGEQGDAFGLTYDGEYLWTTDQPGSSSTPAVAMKLDWNGNIIEEFNLPDHYMSGIAFDNGDFWVSRYYPDPGHLYKVNDSGVILDEFDGPDDQPWDLAIENENVWIADYWGDTLYRINILSGNVIESHASQGVDPAGIVWDGQFLWYCDNGDNYTEDMLYKIDLQGGGTPEILIQDLEHGFGNVAIGDTEVWHVDVQNTGTASLVISDVAIEPAIDLECTSNFPMSIPVGGTTQLTIEYTPSTFGALDATVNVLSNDPVQPDVPLQITGHGVYPDPTIHIAEDSHDFGSIRLGSHTRWFIEIVNHGADPLVLGSVNVDNKSFYIDQGVTIPIILDTLEQTEIGVWFSPSSTDAESASVFIFSNDATQYPATVALYGSAVEAEYPMGTHLWSYQIEGGWDNSPKAMSPIQDISGDGRDDVIVCSEDYFVRCFNGNADSGGDILWEHEIYSGSIYSGKGLDAVEDTDGDGFSDVVVGATGGARLIRMLSGKTGDELWSYHTNEVGSGGWVYQVDGSRDFTGDGVIDVLACAGDDGEDSGPKRAYCLNGITGDVVWQRPLGGPVFAIIAVDDFTGDGIPDALAGASNEMETQGRAVGMNGATGIIEWSFDVDGSSVWSLAQIGDLTLDGVNDVIIGELFYGNFYAINASSGSEIYSGGGLGFMTGFQRIDDVNGDGHPDIVPEHFNDFVTVISGLDGNTIWSTPVADNPTVASQIADLNADGTPDLVVGTLFSNNYAYFVSGVDGSILHSTNFGTPVDAITATPDVVGDGSWELVAGGRNGLVRCLSGGTDAVTFDPADINQDGFVNVTDLLIVLEQWGNTDSPADITGDGIVDVSDLLAVIAAWGDSP